MARKSPLTPRQWADIERRLLNGEKGTALAKEYKISYNAIKKRFGSVVNQIKDLANQIISTEEKFRKLPISSQMKVVNYIERLQSISELLCNSADEGAKASHVANKIVAREMEKLATNMTLGILDLPGSIETLTQIQKFAVTANTTAQTGLNLLVANAKRKDGGDGSIAREIVLIDAPDA